MDKKEEKKDKKDRYPVSSPMILENFREVEISDLTTCVSIKSTNENDSLEKMIDYAYGVFCFLKQARGDSTSASTS